jgi:hypothetical protein
MHKYLPLHPDAFFDIEDIDAHWWFERPANKGPALRLLSPPAPPYKSVLEPSVVRIKGRPRKDHITR